MITKTNTPMAHPIINLQYKDLRSFNFDNGGMKNDN